MSLSLLVAFLFLAVIVMVISWIVSGVDKNGKAQAHNAIAASIAIWLTCGITLTIALYSIGSKAGIPVDSFDKYAIYKIVTAQKVADDPSVVQLGMRRLSPVGDLRHDMRLRAFSLPTRYFTRYLGNPDHFRLPCTVKVIKHGDITEFQRTAPPKK